MTRPPEGAPTSESTLIETRKHTVALVGPRKKSGEYPATDKDDFENDHSSCSTRTGSTSTSTSGPRRPSIDIHYNSIVRPKVSAKKLLETRD
ncbi:unnamed protein product, partial [Choristocarpus tenellus]